MELSPEEMDTLFITGMRININKIEESLTEEEKLVFEDYLRIKEAKEFLKETDHKDLPSYKPYEGEDLEEIKKIRNVFREYIRTKEKNV